MKMELAAILVGICQVGQASNVPLIGTNDIGQTVTIEQSQDDYTKNLTQALVFDRDAVKNLLSENHTSQKLTDVGIGLGAHVRAGVDYVYNRHVFGRIKVSFHKNGGPQ
jgi:hypothetical protein